MFKKIICLMMVFCMVISGILVGKAEISVSVSVSAASSILYEPETGMILFEKNAYEKRAMASTTKIMTALLAAEWVAPKTEVIIPAAAFPVEGTSMGIKAGDHISLQDLITGLLLESGNDAANAIAILVCGSQKSFADKMNKRASKIGMKSTNFVTPSGLDAEQHYTTAYDMALLAAEALENDLLADIFGKKTAVIHVGNPMREATVRNHNRLLSLYPDAIGLKTGFTKKAGRCLVSAAEKDGVTLIAVTLNAPSDWDDHMNMYTKGFPKLQKATLPIPELPTLPVSGGVENSVKLITEAPPSIIVQANGNDSITTKMHLPRFITAPVVAGEEVGSILYYRNNKLVVTMPIMVEKNIDARPVRSKSEWFWSKFYSLLHSLLY